MSDDPVLLIGCGIFAREFSLLDAALRRRFEASFLDSMLHMRPALLGEALAPILAEAGERPRVILYGDCCPAMAEFSAAPGACRTFCTNCVELALGGARYRRLRGEGAFFFMPEWLPRWEEVFERELGFLSIDRAAEFLRESASRLVYVDTGSPPPPEAELARLGERFGLPVLIERAEVAALEGALRKALAELDRRPLREGCPEPAP
ncbi:MAG: DUF1638 domain-containing protein [Treponema sp.]|nr:DUF1638 domain-containing protein [Treponema sp.]